jgi:hypothetical protein
MRHASLNHSLRLRITAKVLCLGCLGFAWNTRVVLAEPVKANTSAQVITSDDPNFNVYDEAAVAEEYEYADQFSISDDQRDEVFPGCIKKGADGTIECLTR